jgi:hypothetical protein
VSGRWASVLSFGTRNGFPFVLPTITVRLLPTFQHGSPPPSRFLHASQSRPPCEHPASAKQLHSCEHRFEQQHNRTCGGAMGPAFLRLRTTRWPYWGSTALNPKSRCLSGCAWMRSGLGAEICSFDGGSQTRVFVPRPPLMMEAVEVLRACPVLASGEAFTR